MIPYGETGRGGDVLGRRIALGLAVDRRGGGEDDARAGGRSRLEDALAREHVPLDVEREDVAEAADARLAGEVEDAVEAGEVELVAGEVEALHVNAAGVLAPSAQGRSSR